MDSGSSDRLHVRVECPVCFGTRTNNNGRQCPYCGVDGKTFIEASMNVLKETLLTQYSFNEKDELLRCLESGSNF